MPDPSPPSQPTRFRLVLPRGRELRLEAGRPLLLGVVNITPDSFSDGGRYLDPGAAVMHGLRLLSEGADALDLGAESTR
ncbi:MAG TPA: dihydropteroate synthase, partial [Thermoanaerobaculia bacterium]|nr:dihydropteroate synthase [Thermoanaerobaculia bacterium]